MTPEEKPFDTSRIPVFYQNGSVKVGDKEYAPGEYPLGTDTMTDVDTSTKEMRRMCLALRLELPHSVAKDVQERVEALAAERDELSLKLNETAHTAKAALDRCDELERLAGALDDAAMTAMAHAMTYRHDKEMGDAQHEQMLAKVGGAHVDLTTYQQRKGE